MIWSTTVDIVKTVSLLAATQSWLALSQLLLCFHEAYSLPCSPRDLPRQLFLSTFVARFAHFASEWWSSISGWDAQSGLAARSSWRLSNLFLSNTSDSWRPVSSAASKPGLDSWSIHSGWSDITHVDQIWRPSQLRSAPPALDPLQDEEPYSGFEDID